MINKIIAASAIMLLALTGCKKEGLLTGTPDKSMAYVSFTNANAGSRVINVFTDTSKLNNVSVLAANATLAGTYAGIIPGSKATLSIRDTTTASTIEYYAGALNVTGGRSYSFYLYDTVTAGKLKGILLETDRTPDADINNSKVRFLNLSPGAPALDFVMVRREATVARDSVVVSSNMPYLGNVATPDVTALSAFKSVLGNKLAGATSATSGVTDYQIKVKLAGTQTVVVNTTITIVPTRNYTFFVRGRYSAIGITSMFNNP